MIYDCVFHLPTMSFVCALPHGHEWSCCEKREPFFITTSQDLVSGEDTEELFSINGQIITVKKSEIDSALVSDNG